MSIKNSDIYDAVSEAIEKTINNFIGDDPYYYIAPYLYEGEIDKNCPFFSDNRITLANIDLNSDELKTITYLAPFYRNRIAYNPKNIDYYLWSLGHIPYSQRGFDIACYENIDCSTPLISDITYESWLLLDGDYTTLYNTTIDMDSATIAETIAYAST